MYAAHWHFEVFISLNENMLSKVVYYVKRTSIDFGQLWPMRITKHPTPWEEKNTRPIDIIMT